LVSDHPLQDRKSNLATCLRFDPVMPKKKHSITVHPINHWISSGPNPSSGIDDWKCGISASGDVQQTKKSSNQ
jgi:hypothetical protein